MPHFDSRPAAKDDRQDRHNYLTKGACTSRIERRANWNSTLFSGQPPRYAATKRTILLLPSTLCFVLKTRRPFRYSSRLHLVEICCAGNSVRAKLLPDLARACVDLDSGTLEPSVELVILPAARHPRSRYRGPRYRFCKTTAFLRPSFSGHLYSTARCQRALFRPIGAATQAHRSWTYRLWP